MSLKKISLSIIGFSVLFACQKADKPAAKHDHAAMQHEGHNHAAMQHEGHDHAAMQHEGHDHAAMQHDHAAMQHEGHDHAAMKHEGHDHAAMQHDHAAMQHDHMHHHHQAPANGARPQAALHGMDADGTMHIHDSDHCPVCAMLPNKHPKNAAAVELEDGRTYYTCGTGCMIKAQMHPEVFLGKGSKVKRVVAHNYMTGEPIDANQALWIAGSDVVGPMGPAFVAVKNEKEKEAFIKRHGGKTVFKLSEMDDALWLKIKGKPAVMHKK